MPGDGNHSGHGRTVLNDQPVSDKAAQLEDNDIIEVANIKLEFFTE